MNLAWIRSDFRAAIPIRDGLLDSGLTEIPTGQGDCVPFCKSSSNGASNIPASAPNIENTATIQTPLLHLLIDLACDSADGTT
jgi:hypothetical protein